MREKRLKAATGVLISAFALGSYAHAQRPQSPERATLNTELARRISVFDTQGQTFLDSFLRLVWTYQLPTGIEYIDHGAATQPLHLRLSNVSVRKALASLVAQLPEYRIDFSQGVVDLYSPSARANHSNVLNTKLHEFSVTNETAKGALWNLWESLASQLQPGRGFLGNYLDNPSAPRISLAVHNYTAHQILNEIVAKDGHSMWTVTARPDQMSSYSTRLWTVEPLAPSVRSMVLEELTELFKGNG
jgi:hypothetical protein